MVLKNTSELVRSKARSGKNNSSRNGKTNSRRVDYFGADLRKTNLRGADLRGACLIAATEVAFLLPRIFCLTHKYYVLESLYFGLKIIFLLDFSTIKVDLSLEINLLRFVIAKHPSL